MGCPDIYYKRALQNFAYCLAAEDTDFALARKLYKEECGAILENFIMKKKMEMDEKRFFYDAGQTCQVVLREAYEEGCDAMNASCGGIVEFEYLIGIREDNN